MASSVSNEKKKTVVEHSPPTLRPRHPSTSTPLPVNSRKRKPSAAGNPGRVAKKKNDKEAEKMFHSPKLNGNGGKKSTFKLGSPTLKVPDMGKEPNGIEENLEPNLLLTNCDLENSGTLESDSFSLLDDNVFADTPTQASNIPSTPADSLAGGNGLGVEEAKKKEEDPLTKLHILMAENFASIKTDTRTMSGQLGMLQSDVSTLNSTIETVKTDLAHLNNRLTNVTAQAVTNKCGIATINKKLTEMQNRQEQEIKRTVAASVSEEIEKIKTNSNAILPDSVSQQLHKMNQEIDKLRAVQAVQKISNPTTRRSCRGASASTEDDESRQYWAARKMLRCSPINPGNSSQELFNNALAYLSDVLDIPAGELHPDALVEVRRVPGKKRDPTMNEAVLTFDSVQTRDCVASYAANLAAWRASNSNLRAGLRLVIPDFLCGVFRVLERHAHQLKSSNSFFRRSIKFDDVNQTLFLDYCTKEGGQWQRIHYEEAAELTRGRYSSHRSSTSSAKDVPPSKPNSSPKSSTTTNGSEEMA